MTGGRPAPPASREGGSWRDRARASPVVDRWRWRAHTAALRLLAAATGVNRRHRDHSAHRAAHADETAAVRIVVLNAFGVGGIIRSAVTQANQLARDGVPVTLVSVLRGPDQARPFFELGPKVELRLLDEPPGDADRTSARHLARRLLAAVPSVLVHPDETRVSQMSLWRDLVLLRELRRYRSGTVVGTRAGVSTAIAHGCRPGVVTVGQEHVPLSSHASRLLRELATSYGRLDGLLMLTRADADVARNLLAGAPTSVQVVPNALPDTRFAVADGTAQVVVTAGRLSRGKRQDLLLRAFASVAPEHPAWRLRVYGRGPREARLARLARQLGMADRVRLMGVSDRLGEDLAEASIFVLSSEVEAFGLVLVEAMRCGLAVVSTDCPHGPRELIRPGHDGLLVPPDDVDALADALRRLMDDAAERSRLGAEARRTARAYEPDVVARSWAAAYRDAARVSRTRSRRRGASSVRPRWTSPEPRDVAGRR